MNNNRQKQQLADLQLPVSLNSITVLVVADVNLSSASHLAEHLLRHSSSIDLIMVGGPLSHPSDLKKNCPNNNISTTNNNSNNTPEHAAARLGLFTATLSQLENIVCRVVYCCGDERKQQQQQQRLTPNARCVTNMWLPIAPSLGVVGYYCNNYNALHSDTTATDNRLEALLKLAPNIRPPFATCQSILVTEYNTSNDVLDGESTSWDDDDVDDVDEFFESYGSGLDQQSVSSAARPWEELLPAADLCLHVACGTAVRHRPPALLVDDTNHPCFGSSHSSTTGTSSTTPKGRGRCPVLFPGSLRDRGDYCLLELSVVPENDKLLWKVAKVDFYQVDVQSSG